MKNFLRTIALLIPIVVLLNSCYDAFVEPINNRLIMFKIDYLTGTFEGGNEIIFTTSYENIDSVPVIRDFAWLMKEYYDFLIYLPSNQVIFKGYANLTGYSEIVTPSSFSSPELYPTCNIASQLPDTNSIQILFHQTKPIPYLHIWGAIKKLSIVRFYLDIGGHVALYLYRPHFDEEEWKWILLMYR